MATWGTGTFGTTVWGGAGVAPPGSTCPYTAQQFIYQAFRKCGQMRPGYIPGPEILQDALFEWFLLFDGFNAKRTMAYTMPDFVFPITGPGHGVTGNGQTFGGSGYQIGPTALDFVAPRPEAIVRMNLYYTQQPTGPTRIPLSQISMEEWMNIAVIQITPINVTTVFAYDPQYPNGVIWVWPPLNGNGLEIFTWGALTPPATLSSPWCAPPGYADLVVHQLAVRLWGMCDHDMMPERRSFAYVCAKAEQCRQDVMAVNAPMPRMRNDFRPARALQSGVSDWTMLLTGIPY